MSSTTQNARPTAVTTARPGIDSVDVGLLILRVTIGLTLAAHGAQKLFGWFGGGGLDGTAAFFGSAGYPNAKTFAVIAGLSETVGGLALAAGLFTPLAAAAILGTMINAIAVKWGGGFFSPQGVEYELVLALAAASLAITGPGGLAVDRGIPAVRAHKFSYGAGAILLAVAAAGVTLLVRN